MEALSRGDAQAALDLSATQPATTDLLTDDILKKQLDKLPITEVEVIGEADRKPDADKRTAAVKVAREVRWSAHRRQTRHGRGRQPVEALGGVRRCHHRRDPRVRGSRGGRGVDGVRQAAAAEPPLLRFSRLPRNGHGHPCMSRSTNCHRPRSTMSPRSRTRESSRSSRWAPMASKPRRTRVLAWINKCFNPGDHTGCGDIITGTWTNTYDMSTMRVRGPVDLPPDIFPASRSHHRGAGGRPQRSLHRQREDDRAGRRQLGQHLGPGRGEHRRATAESGLEQVKMTPTDRETP